MKAFLQINSKINIVHFLKASCWNVLFTKGPALFSNLCLRDGPPGVGHVLCAHRQIVGHPTPPGQRGSLLVTAQVIRVV